jgi:DNA-binding beta-propeller fold protein YncE
MITNPAGTLLFVADVNNKQIDVYQIGSGGGLTLASGSPLPLPSGFEPYNMAVDGLGKYLYVSNNNGGEVTNEVAAYSIGSTGTLTPAGSPFSSGIIQMQGESSGKYMIGITSPLVNADNHLYVMNIGATGALTQTLFPTVNVPGALTVQPSSGGDFVSSFPLPGSGGDGAIEGYQLSLSGGTLTAISGSPFTVTGLNAQFDQTGQYLFVLQSTNGIASAIQAYNVGTSSTLATPIATVGWAAGGWSPATVQ